MLNPPNNLIYAYIMVGYDPELQARLAELERELEVCFVISLTIACEIANTNLRRRVILQKKGELGRQCLYK